nr:MAG TPA_asm: hypothetical protein [Caudoviricetes sp.]DAX09933.1 MAG TPA: hypothetical protein [Bacteriophage sp.]
MYDVPKSKNFLHLGTCQVWICVGQYLYRLILSREEYLQRNLFHKLLCK